MEIRTNPQALTYAKQHNISKTLVPRFSVQVPKSPYATESNLTVFVSNLPYSVTSQEVQRHFESCGRVQRVAIPTREQQDFKFGFVTFYELEAVQKAIKELDGTKLHERTIAVRKYIPKVG